MPTWAFIALKGFARALRGCCALRGCGCLKKPKTRNDKCGGKSTNSKEYRTNKEAARFVLTFSTNVLKEICKGEFKRDTFLLPSGQTREESAKKVAKLAWKNARRTSSGTTKGIHAEKEGGERGGRRVKLKLQRTTCPATTLALHAVP